MIPLLAQSLPDPGSAQSIGWLALAGFALVGGVNQVLKLTDRFKEKPTPSATYATKTELAKVEGDLQESLAELAADLKREASTQAGKRKQIYEEIEQLGKDMATVKADQTNQTRQLFNMEQKLDRLLEKSIRS